MLMEFFLNHVEREFLKIEILFGKFKESEV